jgi:hypothetical protein
VPGTTVTEDKGPLSKDYYAGSPLAQTLGVGASLASVLGSSPMLDSKGNIRYDQLGNMITQPNSLQKLFDSSGISGLASSAGSSISNYLKGFGGSNISGTPAANAPYIGQPSGSLSQDTAANQESNQYFDLPAGVRPDGQGGYVNQYGDSVDANGTFNYESYIPGGGSYEQGGQDNYFDYEPSAPYEPYIPGGGSYEAGGQDNYFDYNPDYYEDY